MTTVAESSYPCLAVVVGSRKDKLFAPSASDKPLGGAIEPVSSVTTTDRRVAAIDVRVFSVANDIFARCNCKSRVNI